MTNVMQLTPQGEREIVVTRDFDAPRELVFEAWRKQCLHFGSQSQRWQLSLGVRCQRQWPSLLALRNRDVLKNTG